MMPLLEDLYHLKVKVIGNKIRVFDDDMENAILEYEDVFPFMGGGRF
ncbi:hypothetical protein [Flavivirga sp. 57AJ16]|nr:hypothetical protein [Flavivirga sp. 57AJ16]MDD7886286.1 hypothetical protein [Flavivirga sp. 57AJ16]